MANDQRSFEALYRRHARATFVVSLSILRDSNVAETVAQETWLALWRRRNAVRIHGESLLPWLLVTSRNLSLKYLRDNKSRLNDRVIDVATAVAIHTDPLVAVEQQDLRSFIDRELRTLSAIDRSIYELCLVEGVSYEAAAHKLQITASAVKNRLFRIRGRLKKSLTEYRS